MKENMLRCSLEITDKIREFIKQISQYNYAWLPEIKLGGDKEILLTRAYELVTEYSCLLDNIKIKENSDIIYFKMEARVFLHIMFLASYQFTIEQLQSIDLIDKELLERQLYYMNYTNLQDILPQGEFAQFYYWLDDRREYEEDLGCWDSIKRPLSEEEIETRWSNKLKISNILKTLKENFNYKVDAIDKYSQAPFTILKNEYNSERISEEFPNRHHIHQLIMNDYPYKYEDLLTISTTDNLIINRSSELVKLVKDRDAVRIKSFIDWLKEALIKETSRGFWHYSHDKLLKMIPVKWSLSKSKNIEIDDISFKKYEISEIVLWYAKIVNIDSEISDLLLFKAITGRKFINEIIFKKSQWMSNTDLTITYIIDQELTKHYEKYYSAMNKEQILKYTNFMDWLKKAVEEEKTTGYWQEQDVPNNTLYVNP